MFKCENLLKRGTMVYFYKLFLTFVLCILSAALLNCIKKSSKLEVHSKMSIYKEAFGKTTDGEEIDLFTLTNSNGLRAKVTNYGAIWVSLEVPDRDGKNGDITLGYDNLDGYISDTAYLGATVGRYACGIANGKFQLNGIEYTLALNAGEKHAHGGIKGFNKVVWKGEEVKDDKGVGIKFTYLSKDGEEGYPGNLSVTVSYTLTNDDEFKISYEAETDKPAIINLTNHSYFNLTGDASLDILGHELTINADNFIPLDNIGLPQTGEKESVKGTPLDFTQSEEIGARINNVGVGYDHCYVLNTGGGLLNLAAKVYEPKRGRVMEIYTTEPGLVFYTGNFLEVVRGKGGRAYHKHHGFCLETQHFPDSPNHPEFPSVILNPGEKYNHITVHKFYAK